MSQIIYDFQKFQFSQIGGIPRYFSSLISELKDNSKLKVKLLVPNKILLLNNKTYFSKVKWYLKQQLTNFKNLESTKKYIKGHPSILLHPTYYNPYVTRLGLPYIITVFDMIHEKFPHSFPFYDLTVNNKKKVIKNAQAIIAISNTTKKDLIEYYDIDHSKVHVIPLASSISLKKKKKIDLPGNFLLFVGARYTYKNFPFFIKAFSKILKYYPRLNLVCVGGGVFDSKEKKLIKKLDIDNHIIQIKLSDEELSYCYSSALAFIFPSLYEGFGLPIVEAFSCECPVILSKTSCFPEIAGDAAIYFDPNSIDSIKNTIINFLDNPNKRKDLIKKGKIISKKYSWRKTASKTIKLYESLS